MIGLFRIIQKNNGQIQLDVSHRASGRLDAKILKTPEVTVIVLGHPHRGAEGWVEPSYVRKAFSEKGVDFIHDIHGYFLIIIFEEEANLCHIFLDRFGGYKLFSLKTSDRHIFSENIFDLASQTNSLTLRTDSIFELVNFGFIFDNKTMFEEIERIRCGIVLRLEKGKSEKISRYWRPIAKSEYGAVSETAVMQAFNSHFRDLFHLCNRASLSLTGGLDSRAILSACLPFVDRVECFTCGDKSNTDVNLASKICSLLKITHRQYPLRGKFIDSFQEDVEEVALETNGLINYVLATNLKHIFSEESERSDVLLTGIGPDLYRAYAIKNLKDRNLPVREMLKFGMLRYRTAWASEILDEINEEEQLERTADSLLVRATHEFEKGTQNISFQTWCELALAQDRTSNYTTHLFAPAGKVMKTWDCWLYKPLVEMSLLIPVEKRLSDLVPRYIIWNNEPLLCRIPSSKGYYAGIGNPPLRVRFAGVKIRASDFIRKGANKIGRALIRVEPVGLNYIPDYTPFMRKYYSQFVRETLDPEEMILRDIIEPDVLVEKVGLFLRGYPNLLRLITNLMSAEIFTRKIAKTTRVKIK